MVLGEGMGEDFLVLQDLGGKQVFFVSSQLEVESPIVA